MKPQNTAVILTLIPAVMVPAALGLFRLDPTQAIFGMTPDFLGGVLIGMSGAMLLAGVSSLFLKRKPK